MKYLIYYFICSSFSLGDTTAVIMSKYEERRLKRTEIEEMLTVIWEWFFCRSWAEKGTLCKKKAMGLLWLNGLIIEA